MATVLVQKATHFVLLPFLVQAVVKSASVVGMRVDLAALRGIWPGAISEIDAALSSTALRHYLVPVPGDAEALSFRSVPGDLSGAALLVLATCVQITQ